jgi:4-amino-4-deoxy-L-arabinose transferase-like glycosyltransferase
MLRSRIFRRNSEFLLLVVTLTALAPFLNKPFHIDDPLFVWMAQQIARHPFDPYGFFVNWSTSPDPAWIAMQNPPLCSYYLAIIGSVCGWKELPLHAAFLAWPVMSILATFAIARRFCREPLIAALLTLSSPVFLVSATNLMCDTMLLALWLWSIEFWIAGLERKSWLILTVSASLAAGAALTKYFGISLVPLLAAYAVTRDRRDAKYLTLLVIPIAALLSFELVTKSNYGTGLFSGAVSLARTTVTYWQSGFANFLTGLAFTGGCLFSAIFFLRTRQWQVGLLATIGGIAVFLLLFQFFVPVGAVMGLGQNIPLVRVEGGVFATIGAGIVALTLADLFRNRDASSLLLALWILGTFSFATFCNWSITGRTILPMAPAVAILVMRSWEGNAQEKSVRFRYLRIFLAIIVSLLITAADYRQATSAKDASVEFQKRFEGEPGTTWFESHWGFQYYMQQWGAKALNAADSEIYSNDVLVLPANSSSVIPLPIEKMFPFETVEFPLFPLISTHGRGTGAAFYSSGRGPIPWSVGRVQPEIYYTARFR